MLKFLEQREWCNITRMQLVGLHHWYKYNRNNEKAKAVAEVYCRRFGPGLRSSANFLRYRDAKKLVDSIQELQGPANAK